MIRKATQEEIKLVADALCIPFSGAMRGVTNGGALIIYDGWTPNAVQVHVYSLEPKFLLRSDFIREIFWYPFVQCHRNIIYSVTPGDADGSLALSKALGFRETYRIADGWKPGIDMIVKEMRREECRYLTVH